MNLLQKLLAVKEANEAADKARIKKRIEIDEMIRLQREEMAEFERQLKELRNKETNK